MASWRRRWWSRPCTARPVTPVAPPYAESSGASRRGQCLWRRRALLLLPLIWACAAAAAPAAAPADCPLAHAPYSSRTVLLDLLLDPAARAVLQREAPAVLQPPFGGGDWPLQPPSFAAIVTPALLLGMSSAGSGTVAALDAALAQVPVTEAATHARCARYDTTPPALPQRIRRPAILVFDKITGFRDVPSVDAAAAALRAMAARRGWTLVSSGNAAVFNARDLGRFDAVVWNNISGDALTVSQQQAFQHWLAAGGGYAGIHGSAGDPVYVWDWYADVLIGARFRGHPMSPQFQQARIMVADPASAITRGLGAGWTMSEEWYSFDSSPRLNGAHVLATLDEASYSPVGMGGQDLRMGDHPIAWTRCLGDGRVFYTAIGHRPENYREPHSARLLEQGIEWAMGRGATRCRAGQEARNR
ncbi:MAG: ThuA domain-containing protein [Gammaproteobacteria bacterium]|nr:ThuA domain-containing protein [Gammaproteobacteria bacterium]